jgi:kumamolisin
MPSRRVPIGQSTPAHPADTVSRGRLPEGDQRRVVIVLKPAEPPEGLARTLLEIDTRLPLSRPSRPSPEELASAHEPPATSYQAVERFAREHELEVVGRSRSQHHVELRGPVKSLEAAFGVELEHFHRAGHAYQSHRGPVHIPAELEGVVLAVLGLDDTPLGHPMLAAGAVLQKQRTYTVPELASRYRFPSALKGAGQRIAIVAFGGGYHQEDLEAYFTERLRLRKSPKVTAVYVPDQHQPSPQNDPLAMRRLGLFIDDMNDPKLSMAEVAKELDCAVCLPRALATFEVTMDIEIVGAIAPEAHIDVYFANPTMWGWRAAILAAAGMRDESDPAPVRADGRPPQRATVLSFSWGAPETQPTGSGKDAVSLALQQAGQRGVTVCCASGDLGSLCVDPAGNSGFERVANVSFPASSPYALACGGTTIRGKDETSWNNPRWKRSPMATGGGVSGYFARPGWQAGSNVPWHRTVGKAWLREDANPALWIGRGVPDVAANADALSGYELHVGGRRAIGGGTSAAAPLWAGLIALLNQGLSRLAPERITLGFLNALLYRRGLAMALRDIDRGNNRLPGTAPGVAVFKAAAGWDACTGLGVPDGDNLFSTLSQKE